MKIKNSAQNVEQKLENFAKIVEQDYQRIKNSVRNVEHHKFLHAQAVKRK